MEVTLVVSFKLLLLLSLLSTSSLLTLSTDFAVGGDGDWALPSSKGLDFYDKWADKNRFIVNDTIYFKYNNKTDNILVVTFTEYITCQSMHPIFFYNSGTTEFKFERAGLFFFISGVKRNCESGEKMMLNVIADSDASPPDGRNNSNSSHPTISSALSSSSNSPSSSALCSSSLPIFSLSLGILALILGFN